MSSSYAHEPLSRIQSEIRLVQVLGDREGKLKCTIKKIELGRASDYIAVSYRWGSPDTPQKIEIDGRELRIGVNLHGFLRTYQKTRNPAARQPLWIDQICIDQGNKDEKEWQVGMMSQIYGRANEVISWLGDQSEHSATAAWMFDLLESDHKLLHHAKWIQRDRTVSGCRRKFFEDLVYTVPLRKRTAYPSSDTSGVTLTGSCKAAMWAFLHNEYWKRLWVVQEMMLARKLSIWLGSYQISWDALRGLTEKVRVTYEDDVLVPWSNLAAILKKGVHRDVPMGYDMPTGVEEELHTVVSTFCRHRCANPRDKVFGLMAIVRPDSMVEIDYSKPIADVYLSAVRVMGEGLLRQGIRLRSPPHWESYLEVSCELGMQMMPERLERLRKGPGYDSLRPARRMGIDPGKFLDAIREKDKPQYLVKKLSVYLLQGQRK